MKETFREYYNRKEKELDEAIKVLNKNGYKVLNEGKITKIITGLALVAGLIVGALAQKSRMCMVGGIRDIVMFKK